jgi:alkylation response protein AidB-like acyl-CoA dehydrogenase
MLSLITSSSESSTVKALEPVLRRHSASSEAERRLEPEVINAMLDAKVFDSLLPRAYGGLELEPLDAVKLFEAIARIDSSAGWLAANQSGLATLLSVLPEPAAAKILAPGRALFAGALFPPGAAVACEGGFRVSGQWPFGSGSDYATWMVGSAVWMDGEEPRMGPHGEPVMMVVVFPAADAEVIDTWDTVGMRGTGSKDIRVNDIFVPADRTWVIGPQDPPTGAFGAPIFRLGFWIISGLNAAVGLGIARAALDDLVSLAGKTPAYTGTALGDRPVIQDRVARATATLDAARSYLYLSIEDACEFVTHQPLLGPELGLPLSLAGVYAMEAAAQVVDMVHASAGTSAIRNELPFQRYLRDIRTLTQHAYSSTSRYQSIGKLLLGRETDWAFYAI